MFAARATMSILLLVLLAAAATSTQARGYTPAKAAPATPQLAIYSPSDTTCTSSSPAVYEFEIGACWAPPTEWSDGGFYQSMQILADEVTGEYAVSIFTNAGCSGETPLYTDRSGFTCLSSAFDSYFNTSFKIALPMPGPCTLEYFDEEDVTCAGDPNNIVNVGDLGVCIWQPEVWSQLVPQRFSVDQTSGQWTIEYFSINGPQCNQAPQETYSGILGECNSQQMLLTCNLEKKHRSVSLPTKQPDASSKAKVHAAVPVASKKAASNVNQLAVFSDADCLSQPSVWDFDLATCFVPPPPFNEQYSGMSIIADNQTSEYAVSFFTQEGCEGTATNVTYGQGTVCQAGSQGSWAISLPIITQCTLSQYGIKDHTCQQSAVSVSGLWDGTCVRTLDPNAPAQSSWWMVDQVTGIYYQYLYSDPACDRNTESFEGEIGACMNEVVVACNSSAIVAPSWSSKAPITKLALSRTHGNKKASPIVKTHHASASEEKRSKGAKGKPKVILSEEETKTLNRPIAPGKKQDRL